MTKNSRIGSYIETSTVGEKVKAYVPAMLPIKPPLELESLQAKIEKANQALGRLDGITSLLPDTSLLIYFFVRKEALLSSQIEGTQSSFDDLLLYESKQATGVPVDDVEEVSHYVAAIQHGLQCMKDGLPLSQRLIKEMHKILLRGGRGSTKQPGEIRQSQNWIGGTRPGNAIFVPPPAGKVLNCLSNLEKYLNDEYGQPPTLIKAAIGHVQFETIHPFLDGNGRVGRQLITLIFCAEGVLHEPVLYLSLYFKKHRKTYYELLTRVREKGDWEVWIEFFLDGVIETANQAATSAREIVGLFASDKAKVETLGRASASALRVFEHIQRQPIVKIPTLAEALETTQPTITASLEHLETIGIVKEISGRKRDRTYAYKAYVDILSEDTEPL